MKYETNKTNRIRRRHRVPHMIQLVIAVHIVLSRGYGRVRGTLHKSRRRRRAEVQVTLRTGRVGQPVLGT